MTKKLSIIACLFILVGGIGSVLTFSSMQQNSAAITTELSDVTFESIQIDSKNSDIVLVPSQDSTKIEVAGQNAQAISDNLVIDQQEDTLIIQNNHQQKKWVSFGFDQFPKTKIYLPEKEYETIEVTGESTDIVMEDLTAKQLEVKVKTGDIHLDKITGDLSAESNSGDISLSQIDGESVNSRTEVGDTVLENVSAAIDVQTGTGDVSLRHDQITDSINVETKNGDIVIQAQEFPDDTQFDTTTKVGDVVILDQQKQVVNNQNSGTMIQLETGTGDIVVKEK